MSTEVSQFERSAILSQFPKGVDDDQKRAPGVDKGDACPNRFDRAAGDDRLQQTEVCSQRYPPEAHGKVMQIPTYC